MKKIGVILDSNYFLHFKRPSDINWLSVLGNKDITFLVTPPVKGELERKKYDGSEKNRKRAERVSTLFKTWFSSNSSFQLSDNLKIESVRREVFSFPDLDPNHVDDQIISYGLDIKSKNRFDEIIILTGDFGLQERAREFGLSSVELSLDHALPAEKDDKDKELERIKKKLQDFESRSPNLKVHFENKDLKKHHKLTKVLPWSQEVIDEQIEKLKFLNKKVELPQFTDVTRMITSSFRTLDDTAYNSSLERYYREYEDYLKELNAFVIRKSLIFEVELYLTNDGGAPAKDVDLDYNLKVPEGTLIYEKSEHPVAPKKPIPPDKPGTVSIRGVHGPRDFLLENFNPIIRQTPPNISSPDINEDDNSKVYQHVQTIKHQNTLALKSFFIEFPSYEEARAFKIECDLLSEEMPKAFETTLHFLVEKEEIKND